MKYALFILLPAMLFIPSTSYADEFWGNIKHGSSRKIGKFEYYSDGTSSQRIGKTKFYSDGTSETTIGNYTYRSDGGSSTKIGNHTYRSDSNNGTDIGNFHFYDGSSVHKMDGFRWTDD